MRKMFPLSVSLVLASGALFADAAAPQKGAAPYDRGNIVPQGQLPEAYNAPAGIEIKGSEGRWRPDMFVDLTFLYYLATEEGLDLAVSGSLQPNNQILVSHNSRNLKQDFDFQPGFKVGVGTNFWEWCVTAEYTWIRQFNETHKSAPNPSPNNGTGVWYMDEWFIVSNGTTQQSLGATKVESKWKLAVDLADLSLGRPYYLGRYLTIAPSFGVRGAWIRQKMNVKIDLPPLGIQNQLDDVSSHNSSHSWAVGPRGGLTANVLLGQGFRLQGIYLRACCSQITQR